MLCTAADTFKWQAEYIVSKCVGKDSEKHTKKHGFRQALSSSITATMLKSALRITPRDNQHFSTYIQHFFWSLNIFY